MRKPHLNHCISILFKNSIIGFFIRILDYTDSVICPPKFDMNLIENFLIQYCTLCSNFFVNTLR